MALSTSPRKSVYDALKEAGRRTSRATIEATKRLSGQMVLTADADAQKFLECSMLTDINDMMLKCDDIKAFHSVMPQFLLTQNFADVPFKIEDSEHQTTLFQAHLTSEEFVVESMDGKPILSVVFANDHHHTTDFQAIGQIKHPTYGIQLYRIMQLFNATGRNERFVVRKTNDHCNEPYMRVSVKRPFLYKVGKWLGLMMDSRKFRCTTGETYVAKIRPKIGWNARNLGYFIRCKDDYKNYTVKTVCVAFTLMMFLKFSPLDFERLLTS